MILIHTRHFPPRSFHAITIFPFVFFNGKPLTEREIRHEKVHLWQQAALLIVPFYLLYLVFWLYGLARYRNADRAYREIPFERSAYKLEKEGDSKPTNQSFSWLIDMLAPSVDRASSRRR